MAEDVRSNRQKLYDHLYFNNPNREQMLKFKDFSRLLDDPASSKQLYDAMEREGAFKAEGGYEEFVSQMQPTDSWGRFLQKGISGAFELYKDIAAGTERLMSQIPVKRPYEMEAERMKKRGASEEAIAEMERDPYEKIQEDTWIPYGSVPNPQGPASDYRKWSLEGLAKGGLQTLPQVGAYAPLFSNPMTMGLAAIGEAEPIWQEMDRYEQVSGEKVNPVYRVAIPLAVGAVNAALEKVSFGKGLSVLKADVGLRNTLMKTLIAQGTEVGTEMLQQLTSEMTKLGYQPEAFEVSNIVEAGRMAIGTSLWMGAGGAVRGITTSNGPVPLDQVNFKQINDKINEISETFKYNYEKLQAETSDNISNMTTRIQDIQKNEYLGDSIVGIRNLWNRMKRHEDIYYNFDRFAEIMKASLPEEMAPIIDRVGQSVKGTRKLVANKKSWIEYMPDSIKDRLPQRLEDGSFKILTNLVMNTEEVLKKSYDALQQFRSAIEGGEAHRFSTYVEDYEFFEDVFGEANLLGIQKLFKRKEIKERKLRFRQLAEQYYDISDRLEASRAALAEFNTPSNMQEVKLLEQEMGEFLANPEFGNVQKVLGWFEARRQDIVNTKRELLVLQNVPEKYRGVFEDMINDQKTFLDVALGLDKDAKSTQFDDRLIEMFTNAILEVEGVDTEVAVPYQIVKGEPKKARSSEKMLGVIYGNLTSVEMKKMAETLKDQYKEWIRLANWGKKNYVTKIETGMYKVIDNKTGHVVAVRETRAQAIKVARQMVADGTLESFDRKRDIDSSFRKPLDPTAESQEILAGEPDLMKALKTYSQRVRQYTVMSVLHAQWEDAKKNDPAMTRYDKGDRAVIDSAYKTLLGNYSIFDQATDIISRAFGTKPRAFSRAVHGIRKIEAVLKMGYRYGSGLINLASGLHKTWVKYNAQMMKEANDFMKSDDGQKLLHDEEKYLGVDYARSAYGMEFMARQTEKLKKAGKLFHPLTSHSWPEPYIRKMAYSTAYLDAKRRGESELGARKHARRAVRLQAGIYDMAALPQVLRGPMGELVGQFRSYLANEMAFISTLKPYEIARYMAFHIALTGPRGMVLFMKSVPFLGMLGKLDELEEWLLAKGQDKDGTQYSYGIPGALGFDVTGPAMVQILNGESPWDNMGAFVSDMAKTVRTVITPAVKKEIDLDATDFKDLARQTVVLYKYIEDLVQAVQTEDGWVRNPYNGQKVFRPNVPEDMILLGMGINPIDRSVVGAEMRALKRFDGINKEKQYRWTRRALDKMMKGDALSEDDIDDAIAIGLGETLGQDLQNGYKLRILDPQTRILMKTHYENLLKTLSSAERVEETVKKK